MPDILIKNTRIYYNNSLQPAEIIIEDGKVTRIGKDLRVSSSAAAGGITTVIDQPNTVPPTTDRRAFEQKLKLPGESLLLISGLMVE